MLRHRKFLLSAILALAWSAICAAADPVLVVGHRNPDTDSIVSAIAVAHLKTRQGIPAVAIAQGPANRETRFVLDRFKLATPPIRSSVAGQRVILVDHSDYPLAPEDLAKGEVVGLVDHHKLGGLTTAKPIEVWVFPVGSTNTVVARMYAAAGIAIPGDIAGAMLSAIISDTLLFKSPTTTQEDRDTAVKLAGIAGIADVQAFGLDQLAAKSEITGMSGAELLRMDLKTFDLHGHRVGVAQVEVLDGSVLAPRKDELLAAMSILKEEGYHSILLMLTDIEQQGTDLLVVSDNVAIIATALGLKSLGSSAWLPGVVSRKQQVIPNLEKAFE
jgi:manganese-dependent inorganic pyrophosphatase